MKAIQNIGINIDKEELIKALNYDIEQYSNGYSNGYQQGREDERTKVIDEVFSAWVDWNSGKINEEYFDDVIKKLKEQSNE